MGKPKFRHPDKFQQFSFRDWIRENLPTGKEGYVVEDLDLIVRVYSPRFDEDDIGKFMLIELKFGNSWMDLAQEKTFGLMDSLLHKADPEERRYHGFYVIQYDDEDWDKSKFRLNKIDITKEELYGFLMFICKPAPRLWSRR